MFSRIPNTLGFQNFMLTKNPSVLSNSTQPQKSPSSSLMNDFHHLSIFWPLPVSGHYQRWLLVKQHKTRPETLLLGRISKITSCYVPTVTLASGNIDRRNSFRKYRQTHRWRAVCFDFCCSDSTVLSVYILFSSYAILRYCTSLSLSSRDV